MGYSIGLHHYLLSRLHYCEAGRWREERSGMPAMAIVSIVLERIIGGKLSDLWAKERPSR